MVRLCAKILTETDLYDTDMEVRNLIDWICVSEQIKENNNTIRNLTGEYKKIEPDCREGVRVQLERMKELCKEILQKLISVKKFAPRNFVGLEKDLPFRAVPYILWWKMEIGNGIIK